MLALPVRFGGIGIQNPVETAEREYETSVKITENLATLIYHQEQDLGRYNEARVKATMNELKADKEKHLSNVFEYIKTRVNDDLRRSLELAREKCSGYQLFLSNC